MKSNITYKTTFDRVLTALLGKIIAYKITTTDTKEEQIKLKQKLINAIEKAFK